MTHSEPRRFAPATRRNREPIFSVLSSHLPASGGLLVEVASGTGEHACALAPRLAGWRWQPTDVDPEALASIDAWRRHEGAQEHVLAPLHLDSRSAEWPVERADALLCTNMIHISPFAATEGLMRGAARILSAQGRLFTYGPYLLEDQPNAPSNVAFDASLRARDPAWGVRRLSEIDAAAQAYGLQRVECVTMPANNFMLVFERVPTPS